MTSKFVILACIAVAWAASLSESEHEPQCYSRFDYEYKVVQKLVDLDNGQKEQKGNNVAQSDKIEAIEAEMENINSTSHEKLQKLENFDREQTETIKELRTVLDEVKNQNKALLAEIEKLKDKLEENRGQVIAFSTALGTLKNIQSGQVIVFDHIILNEGAGYDVTSGKFTCPRSGVYLITFFIGFRDSTSYNFIASLMVNDNRIIEAQVEGQHNVQDLQGGNSVVINLNKDDEVCVQRVEGRQLGSNTGRASSFSGVLLYPED